MLYNEVVLHTNMEILIIKTPLGLYLVFCTFRLYLTKTNLTNAYFIHPGGSINYEIQNIPLKNSSGFLLNMDQQLNIKPSLRLVDAY